MLNQNVTVTKEVRKRQTILFFSPLMIVPVVFLTAILFKTLLHVWTWVPVLMVYWAAIGTCILLFSGKDQMISWLKRPNGKWLWSVLPFLFTFLAMPVFIENWRHLGSMMIFIPWLLVGIINPFLKNGYWRGLFLDMKGTMPAWLVIAYTSILFGANHLSLAVTSIPCRNPVFLINTVVLGIVYSIVYYKTKSLRWVIIAHALMDFLGMSVLCFLNIYIPPSFG